MKGDAMEQQIRMAELALRAAGDNPQFDEVRKVAGQDLTPPSVPTSPDIVEGS